MVVVLPNKQNGIQLLARDFPRSLNDVINRMNHTEIFVSLPRFSIEYNADLVKILPEVINYNNTDCKICPCTLCNFHSMNVMRVAYDVGVHNQNRAGSFGLLCLLLISAPYYSPGGSASKVNVYVG